MKDIVYANFSQLSYLDWQKLKRKKYTRTEIKKILGKAGSFDKIKTPDYEDWKKSDGYYVRKEEGKKIYSFKDKRIFYLYSEDYDRPVDNPKYPELQDWEFLCAYDHGQIRKEAGNIIAEKDSGFQASAFKKGNEIVITYRGSDDLLEKKHRDSDWIRTNLNLGFNNYTDQLTCAAWFYDKGEVNNE